MSRQRMVVKVKGLFGMNSRQRAALQEELCEWYEKGANPLLLGEGCEVLWGCEKWEHESVWYSDPDELRAYIAGHEVDGWQVAGIDGEAGLVVFKRPARDDDPTPADRSG